MAIDTNLAALLDDLRRHVDKVEQAEAQVKAAREFSKECKGQLQEVTHELIEYFTKAKANAGKEAQ